MLVALNETNKLELRVEHFKKAMELLTALEPSMVKTFASVGRNPYASDLERMAADIFNSNGVSRSNFIKRNIHAMDKRVLDDNIETLKAMGKVEQRLVNGVVWYYTLEG